MVLRFILQYFARNEELINRLADSKPIRRAAQFCVYVFHKTSALNETYKFTDNPKELAKQIIGITKRFKTNVKKEIENVKREIQEKKPK